MAKYRALQRGFISAGLSKGLKEAGEVFEFDGEPGKWMEPFGEAKPAPEPEPTEPFGEAKLPKSGNRKANQTI